MVEEINWAVPKGPVWKQLKILGSPDILIDQPNASTAYKVLPFKGQLLE